MVRHNDTDRKHGNQSNEYSARVSCRTGKAARSFPYDRVPTSASTLELAPYEQRAIVEIGGDDIALTSRACLTVGLAVHELATNAVKYGALSVPGGHLKVAWTVTDTGRKSCLQIDWRETGGPAVTAPSARGFGTRLIELAVSRTLGATVDRRFESTGLTCTIAIPFTKEIGEVIEAPR